MEIHHQIHSCLETGWHSWICKESVNAGILPRIGAQGLILLSVRIPVRDQFPEFPEFPEFHEEFER